MYLVYDLAIMNHDGNGPRLFDWIKLNTHGKAHWEHKVSLTTMHLHLLNFALAEIACLPPSCYQLVHTKDPTKGMSGKVHQSDITALLEQMESAFLARTHQTRKSGVTADT